MNREEWLTNAILALQPEFKAANLSLPPCRVSVGFPSRGGLSRKGSRSIGECWSAAVSKDGVYEIFISPLVDDALRVLDILVHELLHAAVGTKCGHRGPFVKGCRALGLEGRPTATHAGEELLGKLKKISVKLGDYPHAAIDAKSTEHKKQSTRMLKLECPCCGYIVRTTQKWIEYGLPSCPEGTEMEQV